MGKLGDLLKAAGIKGKTNRGGSNKSIAAIIEKADALLVARNRQLWAATMWMDPDTGMPKRRDLCGLMVHPSKITVGVTGRPVTYSIKAIPSAVAIRQAQRDSGSRYGSKFTAGNLTVIN